MNNKKDPMEQMIIDDLLREAASIDEEVSKAELPSMPEGLEEKMKKNIYAQMEAMEKERLYAQLSEEDRKALELGREMLKMADEPEEGKVVRFKKRRRMYLAVAAVITLVLAMGITSIGGPERVIEMVKVAIGGREIVRVETGEDNYIDTSEDEEIAYQKIKDVFGVEAVKPIEWPRGTVFIAAEIDEELHTALLQYEYNSQLINYYISSQFTKSSWGINVDDIMIGSYYIEHDKAKIKIQEYEKPESKEKYYSGQYAYNGLEYFIIGTLSKEDFEVLVKNLGFF